MSLNYGRIIIGGTGAFIVLWVLMQYNMRLAWIYLAVLLLGVFMVYRQIITSQFGAIASYLKLM